MTIQIRRGETVLVAGGQGVTVAPVIVRGGVTGPVVKHTSPLIMVCGAVLELVKVLETMP